MSDDLVEMVIPKTLGPGDSDGIVRGQAHAIAGPQRPGDSDRHEVDRGRPHVTRGPLAPGERDPLDTRPEFRMLAQPAPGPGETHTARRITVFPVESRKE